MNIGHSNKSTNILYRSCKPNNACDAIKNAQRHAHPLHLKLSSLDSLGVRYNGIDIVHTEMGMMRILDMKQISTFLCMVGTAEQDVNLLEGDGLGLGNVEPDEGDETDVGRHEEEECFSGTS